MDELVEKTLYPAGNPGISANIPVKARIFLPYVGGIGPHHAKRGEVRDNDYEGFVLADRTAPQLSATQEAARQLPFAIRAGPRFTSVDWPWYESVLRTPLRLAMEESWGS